MSEKIRQCRPKFPGHCVRHKGETGPRFALRQPQFGTENRGRKKIIFFDTLLKDKGRHEDIVCVEGFINDCM